MQTMQHIACAFAFSALIAGQFWAVLIAGVKVNGAPRHPSSRARTARRMTHDERLPRKAGTDAMAQGGIGAADALPGFARSIFAIG